MVGRNIFIPLLSLIIMNIVYIGKEVEYKTLEIALIKAAEDIGLGSKVIDNFSTNYQLGSVKEEKKYDFTQINLIYKLPSAMKVCILDKKPTESFCVWTRFPFGFASQRKVKQYLEAVSKYL